MAVGNLYVLDGHTPVDVGEDVVSWNRFFCQREKRIVKQERLGPYFISTVFLAMNHGWGEGPPILFETMVFADKGEEPDQHCRRYRTWDDAEAGHRAVVAWLKAEWVKATDQPSP